MAIEFRVFVAIARLDIWTERNVWNEENWPGFRLSPCSTLDRGTEHDRAQDSGFKR
jgi:hypothetical protein